MKKVWQSVINADRLIARVHSKTWKTCDLLLLYSVTRWQHQLTSDNLSLCQNPKILTNTVMLKKHQRKLLWSMLLISDQLGKQKRTRGCTPGFRYWYICISSKNPIYRPYMGPGLQHLCSNWSLHQSIY